jgi:Cache domain
MPRNTYRNDFRALNFVALALISLFVLAIGLTIWALRSDAIRDADNDTGNIAVVLSGQIARSIQSVDIILGDVRDYAKAQGPQNPEETDRRMHSHNVYELLLEHLHRLPQADVIALIDNTGRVANSTTQWPPTGTDVADRDYFLHFKNTGDSGIYISSLMRNRLSGHRMIFFSKRISGPDDEFLGLVLIGLRLSYFEAVYKSITPLRDQSFVLLHSDGTVLVRYPGGTDRDDETMPAQSDWYRLVASGGGNYRSPGYFDGDARYVSVRPLQDYPLVVNIAVTEAAALSNWYRRATLIAVGALLALVCCCSGCRPGSFSACLRPRPNSTTSRITISSLNSPTASACKTISTRRSAPTPVRVGLPASRFSTSTVSRTSTTRLAIRSATVCCSRWHGD